MLCHRKLCGFKPVIQRLRFEQVVFRFRLVFPVCPIGRAEQTGAELILVSARGLIFVYHRDGLNRPVVCNAGLYHTVAQVGKPARAV